VRHFLSSFGQGECKPCPTGVKPNMTLLLDVRNAEEGDGKALCLRSTATYFAACAQPLMYNGSLQKMVMVSMQCGRVAAPPARQPSKVTAPTLAYRIGPGCTCAQHSVVPLASLPAGGARRASSTIGTGCLAANDDFVAGRSTSAGNRRRSSRRGAG
jgi:hypothetical protein